MTMGTKNEIFQSHLRTYLTASKAGKSEILTHVCAVTGMHHKAAIRKFKQLQLRSPSASPPKRGRPTMYGPDVTAALHDLWTTASEICGELLHSVIADYVSILQRDGMWKHGEETTTKLLTMSEITIKRRVSTFSKASRVHHGVSATKPSQLKEIIPIFIGPWRDKPPGYGQLDTVVHCGPSLVGNMAWTVNWTDVATLWGGRRAQWNKGQRATRESLSTIRDKLPFAMLGAHPDTGSEFVNWLLRDWCKEQGIEKVRIGSKYKRQYDKAQTPYRRVLQHEAINQSVKDKLMVKHEQLNPLILRQQVDTLITQILTIQRDSR